MCGYCNTGSDDQLELIECDMPIFDGKATFITTISSKNKLEQNYIIDSMYGGMGAIKINYCPMCGRKLGEQG